jgi:hypothetical protein
MNSERFELSRRISVLGALLVSIAAVLSPSANCKGLEDLFSFTATIAPDESPILVVELCYAGSGEKEIADLTSAGLKATSIGKWKAIAPKDSLFGTGTGSFGSRVIKSGKENCSVGRFKLARLFNQVSADKATVSLELTVRVLSDDAVIKIQRTFDLQLTEAQIKRFEREAK